MDAKLVIRESLTLDTTINPDFSQVESDDPQVTVNQRFEVFFPEKRPFFLENASYFQTPENLFFSRRIGDPLGGARLTGRLGRWSIGLLAGPTAVRASAWTQPILAMAATLPAGWCASSGISARNRQWACFSPTTTSAPATTAWDRWMRAGNLEELGGRRAGHRQRHAVSGRHAFRGSGVPGVCKSQRPALQLLRQLCGSQSGVSYRPGLRAAHRHPHDDAERQL